MSTQHIATYRNIVGRNLLCAFGHRVAMCCDMLCVVGSSLKMVKFEPTTPNKSQHFAAGWPNARNMLRPTMLRYVALACWNRLAGALGLPSTLIGLIRRNQKVLCVLVRTENILKTELLENDDLAQEPTLGTRNYPIFLSRRFHRPIYF